MALLGRAGLPLIAIGAIRRVIHYKSSCLVPQHSGLSISTAHAKILVKPNNIEMIHEIIGYSCGAILNYKESINIRKEN